MTRPRARTLLPALLLCLSLSPARAATVVFTTDFESGLPAEFSAPGSVLTAVQGYAGLGPAGRQFGGSFLRYTSVPIMPTRLTVRDLPPHNRLSVKFLMAFIDSWDGTELMQISVDDTLRFEHWFQLALGDSTNYYPPPPGALLSQGANLGFSAGSYYARDRAYDLGVEPAFLDIPHTADSVVVVWTIGAISGPAAAQWQGGDDESWAIDGISVEVSTQSVGVGPRAEPGRLAVAASPNPAQRSGVFLRLSLPSRAPAEVELLDLTGRRVARRELSDMVAGQQWIHLADGGALAPGVYLARVTQGRARSVTRVIVLDW